MTRATVVGLLLAVCACAGACAAESPGGLSRFNIVEYGAVDGGTVFCTKAVQKAIDACHAAGGGEVIVPEGTFLTGTIYLKDGVAFHIRKGATLLGSNRIADYPEQEKSGTRMDDYLSRSLIFARGARNISVVGEGVVDGQGRLKQNDFLDDPKRARSYRPMLIWFDRCENILVTGVTFKAAGYWTQTYSRSRNGRISGIRVRDNVNDNNDGCDIVDSRDFVVENCDIDCIDDGICLKAFTEAGCRNVTIRNNRVKSLCNAIKTGTDSSGQGFQDLLIENNHLYQVGRAAIALETTDGGVLRNVIVRNITTDVVGTPIFIKLGDRQRPTVGPGGNDVAPERIGIIKDIHISGIRATMDDETMPARDEYTHDETRLYKQTEPKACSITGIPGHYVEGVTIEDVDIEIRGGYHKPRTQAKYADFDVPENSKKYPNPDMFGILPGYGFFVRHVKGMTMRNVRIATRVEDVRPAIVLDDVHDSKFTGITKESVSDTALFRVKPNCTGITN